MILVNDTPKNHLGSHGFTWAPWVPWAHGSQGQRVPTGPWSPRAHGSKGPPMGSLGTPPWDPWVPPMGSLGTPKAPSVASQQRTLTRITETNFWLAKTTVFSPNTIFRNENPWKKYWQYQNFTLNPNLASELRFKPSRDYLQTQMVEKR